MTRRARGGEGRPALQLLQRPPMPTKEPAYTIALRLCVRCDQRREIGGGRVRKVFRRNMTINEFTCARCVA